MTLKLKLISATILWTVAVATGLGYTRESTPSLLVWAILTAAAAAVVSAMLAGDYIANEAAKYIVERVIEERAVTVDRATSAMREIAKTREDRIVSRVQSANEAALKRVAVEVADAITDDRTSRIH